MKKEIAFGVDIGNVIINHRSVDNNDKILYEERYSTIPTTEGVFESLKQLNDQMFHGNIFLISKCTPWAQEKILGWLKGNNFYAQTGIKPGNVFFCRERHEKDKICRDNNISYFVDDRLEVLSHMVSTVPHLFLYQPDQGEVDEYKQFLSKVTLTKSWKEIMQNIIR
jgi:hypothetical protein